MTQHLDIDLAKWLAGDFSNQQQAFDSPKDFAHIRVFFRPLPWDFFQGLGFYSEQVYNHDLWTPYRQGIHRFVNEGDRVYVENYGLKDRIRYAGAGRELSILRSIPTDAIERRYNCSMVFHKQGDVFHGSVEGNQCLIEKRGCQTYLDSQVELTATGMSTLDRGLDVTTHEQVWGSEHGTLNFEKLASFADEVAGVPVA